MTTTTTIDYTTIDGGVDTGVEVLAEIKTNIQAAENDMKTRTAENQNANITGSWIFNKFIQVTPSSAEMLIRMISGGVEAGKTNPHELRIQNPPLGGFGEIQFGVYTQGVQQVTKHLSFVFGSINEWQIGNNTVYHAGNMVADKQYKGANLQTGVAYTLVLTDAGKLVEMNNAAANDLTVPPNSSVAFPINTKIDLSQHGAGLTSVVAGAGVTVRSKDGLDSSGQYAGMSLWKRGTDEWVLYGGVA